MPNSKQKSYFVGSKFIKKTLPYQWKQKKKLPSQIIGTQQN